MSSSNSSPRAIRTGGKGSSKSGWPRASSCAGARWPAGWSKQAGTVEALATAAGFTDPAEVVRTVEGDLGEAVGLLYPANGGDLSESVCFGRIAAEHALG